jgi:hypothetical protein
MDNKGFSPKLLVGIAQPLNILFSLFTYLLGLGILHYLGLGIDWPVAILGSFIVIMILLSRAYLGAYFRYPDPIQAMGITRTDADDGNPWIGSRRDGCRLHFEGCHSLEFLRAFDQFGPCIDRCLAASPVVQEGLFRDH